jgi:hypothetical protein
MARSAVTANGAMFRPAGGRSRSETDRCHAAKAKRGGYSPSQKCPSIAACARRADGIPRHKNALQTGRVRGAQMVLCRCCRKDDEAVSQESALPIFRPASSSSLRMLSTRIGGISFVKSGNALRAGTRSCESEGSSNDRDGAEGATPLARTDNAQQL